MRTAIDSANQTGKRFRRPVRIGQDDDTCFRTCEGRKQQAFGRHAGKNVPAHGFDFVRLGPRQLGTGGRRGDQFKRAPRDAGIDRAHDRPQLLPIRRDAGFVGGRGGEVSFPMVRAVFRRLVQGTEGKAVDPVDHHLVERPVQLELCRSRKRLRSVSGIRGRNRKQRGRHEQNDDRDTSDHHEKTSDVSELGKIKSPLHII